MEMDGRTKGSLKFADEIFENAKRNLELQNNNDYDKTPKNAIKTLMDPKYQLTDEEIHQEIITLLVAVSEIKFDASLFYSLNLNKKLIFFINSKIFS